MIHSQHFDVYIASCVSSGGIYHYKMNDGHLKLVEITFMDRPMYMVAERKKMYVVLRAPFENGESGVVTYDIDDSGKLVNPSKIQSTKGQVACHILVYENDIYCANYISGSLVKLPDMLVQHEGHGVNPDRQEGAHVHFVGMTSDNYYICVADLGLDSIFLYNMDLELHSAVKVPEGHGVRHLVFSEDGKWLFAVNELKSTVVAFSYHNGNLDLVDVCSAVPKELEGENAAAAIRVKDGFVYVSNRGHDSIAKLSFNDNRLRLLKSYDCGGKTPRDFCFAGNYLLCANQDSDCITILDEDNGFRIKEQIAIEKPVCISAVRNVVAMLQEDVK